VTIFKIAPTKTLRNYYNFIILVRIVSYAYINICLLHMPILLHLKKMLLITWKLCIRLYQIDWY
jgi:hypothetical protein